MSSPDHQATKSITPRDDGSSTSVESDRVRLQPGDRVGHYVIREEAGEGGFAIVYAAEQQEPVRRKVALKIIKPGMDTKQVIARFEAERQALAMMDHPNVAKVFDAGATKTGRPYFVMEFVTGSPITEYCDRHRLDIRQRLGLFIQVCSAIQHAHQKAIIHRDIKPSNVLVASKEGEPLVQVIDFGIAKAISQPLTERTIYTEQGEIIGTPAYMSPEQAEMTSENIDTRADIYSLGVLLYELLVGALPFDPKILRHAAFVEIQRIIREEEPSRPSTRLSGLGDEASKNASRRRTDMKSLVRTLRGDLDWIAMKAMDKDPARRYATAHELAADVTRHLDDEPVTAGRPSPLYRIRKFMRRHRVGVIVGMAVVAAVLAAAGISAAAVLAVASVLAASLVVVSWMYRRAVAARRRAEQARQNEEQARLAAEAAELDAARARVREVEQRRAAETQRDVAETARREAERQAEIARLVNEFLEQMLAAPVPWSIKKGGVVARDVRIVDVLDAASERIEETLGEHPEVEAAVRATLGETYMDLGYVDRGAPHTTRAFEIRRRVLGEEHPDTLKSMRLLGWVYSEQRSLDAAEPLFVRALELGLRVLGEEHTETMASLEALAIQRQTQARYDDAQRLFEQVVEVRRRVQGEEHPRTLLALGNLIDIYEIQGRFKDAKTLATDTLETMKRVLGTEHISTALVMTSLAHIYDAEGRAEEARTLVTEALDTVRRIQGETHPLTSMIMSDLGRLYIDQQMFDEAEPLVTKAVAQTRESLPEGHRWIGICLNHHGRCLTGLKRYSEAEAALREGHRILEHAVGPEHVRTARAITALADLYDAWDKPQESAQWRAKLPI